MNGQKCLRCGGSSLEPGIVQSTGRIYIRPENTKLMTFPISAVALRVNICLDCGALDFVGDVHDADTLAGRASAA